MAKARAKTKSGKAKKSLPENLLLVATRKGAWIYRGDAARKEWRASGPAGTRRWK